MKTPIALLNDDPAPLVHVYRWHWEDVHKKPPVTCYGAPLHDVVPNAFLYRYCDVVEKHGIKGKFSVVPNPARRGDVVAGIDGFDRSLTQEWIDTVNIRLSPWQDFCPEGITHNFAIDLATGEDIPLGESHWSQTQTRETLTPYLMRALSLLKQAGIDANGVTSPWVFGQDVLEEYEASIVEAQKEVYDREFSWYFLHMIFDKPWQRPWVAVPGRLVAIPATVRDHWWETIDSPRTDDAFVHLIVDKMLTESGEGDIPRILEAGGTPILLTHWQSLYSNGKETGLRVLDVLAERINRQLGDQVEWKTCSEIALQTAHEPLSL